MMNERDNAGEDNDSETCVLYAPRPFGAIWVNPSGEYAIEAAHYAASVIAVPLVHFLGWEEVPLGWESVV